MKTRWAMVGAMLITMASLAGCTDLDSPKFGKGDPDVVEEGPGPCEWATTATMCRSFPKPVGAADWHPSGGLIISTLEPFGSLDFSSRAYMLSVPNLTTEWTHDLQDSPTNPSLVWSASGTMAFFADGRLVGALDQAGNVLWQKTVQSRVWNLHVSPYHDAVVVEEAPGGIGLRLTLLGPSGEVLYSRSFTPGTNSYFLSSVSFFPQGKAFLEVQNIASSGSWCSMYELSLATGKVQPLGYVDCGLDSWVALQDGRFGVFDWNDGAFHRMDLYWESQGSASIPAPAWAEAVNGGRHVALSASSFGEATAASILALDTWDTTPVGDHTTGTPAGAQSLNDANARRDCIGWLSGLKRQPTAMFTTVDGTQLASVDLPPIDNEWVTAHCHGGLGFVTVNNDVAIFLLPRNSNHS